MGKEVFFVGQLPEFRISQSSGATTENSVNNQQDILPESGVIFDAANQSTDYSFQLSDDLSSQIDVSNSDQDLGKIAAENSPIGKVTRPPETEVIVFDELVKIARETGVINTLSERRRKIIDLLHPEEGQALNVLQVAERKDVGVSHQAIRKLKTKAYKQLVRELGDILPSSNATSKTKAIREIEDKYHMDIVQVLTLFSRAGFSMREIGSKLKRDHKTIASWFNKISIDEPRAEVRKTYAMRRIEEKFGQKIEYLLKRKYLHEKKSYEESAAYLGICLNTFGKWMKIFEIRSRSLQEGHALALKDPKKRKRMYRKPKKLRQKVARSLERYHRERREKARNSA